MSINNKLNYLNETKELLRQAINAQGVELKIDDTFSKYPEKIAQIDATQDGTGNAIGIDMIPFKQCSLAQFQKIVNGYYAGEISINEIKQVWHVGDVKLMGYVKRNSYNYNSDDYGQYIITSPTEETNLSISDYIEFNVMIIGFGHDELVNTEESSEEEQLPALLTLMFFMGNTFFNGFCNNYKRDYKTPWENSLIRKWLQDNMPNVIFPQLNEMIKTVKKPYYDSLKNEIKYSNDRFFLPSESEMFGNRNENDKIKYINQLMIINKNQIQKFELYNYVIDGESVVGSFLNNTYYDSWNDVDKVGGEIALLYDEETETIKEYFVLPAEDMDDYIMNDTRAFISEVYRCYKADTPYKYYCPRTDEYYYARQQSDSYFAISTNRAYSDDERWSHANAYVAGNGSNKYSGNPEYNDEMIAFAFMNDYHTLSLSYSSKKIYGYKLKIYSGYSDDLNWDLYSYDNNITNDNCMLYGMTSDHFLSIQMNNDYQYYWKEYFTVYYRIIDDDNYLYFVEDKLYDTLSPSDEGLSYDFFKNIRKDNNYTILRSANDDGYINSPYGEEWMSYSAPCFCI